MHPYKLLAQEERHRRFTVSDALDVLDKHRAGFGNKDFAEIKVGGLVLPSRDQVGLTKIFFESPALGKTLVISLAASMKFRAKLQNEAETRTFSIFDLDDARVDNNAMVRLANGIVVRALEVIPAKLPVAPSELDWQIIQTVISIQGAEEHCYSSLREHAKPKCLDVCNAMIPDLKRVDFSRLNDLEIAPLNYLQQQIGRRHWHLKNLSRQKIAQTLRNFGMRIPSRMPSEKASHSRRKPSSDARAAVGLPPV